MEKPTTVWLIRHGLPENVGGRCYGQQDLRLSMEGERQAKAIAAYLARQPLAHIYSSPLRRALETARAVAEPHRLSVETMDAFAEIHFGDFEGLGYDEIQARYPDIFMSWMERPTEAKFPNGENFQEMRQRVLGALDVVRTRQAAKTIVIVAHGGVIRAIVAQALAIPDSQIFRLAQRYGAVNRIDYFGHGATVELLNGYFSAAHEVNV